MPPNCGGREPEVGDTDQRFFAARSKCSVPDGTFMPPTGPVSHGPKWSRAKYPQSYDGEVHIERPDGSHVTVLVNIRPLKNDRGEVAGAINCFYDITERKQMEGRARKVKKSGSRSGSASEHGNYAGRMKDWKPRSLDAKGLEGEILEISDRETAASRAGNCTMDFVNT